MKNEKNVNYGIARMTTHWVSAKERLNGDLEFDAMRIFDIADVLSWPPGRVVREMCRHMLHENNNEAIIGKLIKKWLKK